MKNLILGLVMLFGAGIVACSHNSGDTAKPIPVVQGPLRETSVDANGNCTPQFRSDYLVTLLLAEEIGRGYYDYQVAESFQRAGEYCDEFFAVHRPDVSCRTEVRHHTRWLNSERVQRACEQVKQYSY